MEYIEIIFSSIFLSYFIYIYTIIYSLIPMFIQIIFSYFIQRKNILKTTITIFLTQGIVLGIAQFIYDIIDDIYNNLELWSIISSKSFRYDILYSSILFIILILINIFVYKNEIGKMKCKKFIFLIIGYIVNIAVIIFMMIKFNIFLIPPI